MPSREHKTEQLLKKEKERMGGWMDGWMGGWMDGWMDRERGPRSELMLLLLVSPKPLSLTAE